MKMNTLLTVVAAATCCISSILFADCHKLAAQELNATSRIQDEHPVLGKYLNAGTEFVLWCDPQAVTEDELTFLKTTNPGEPDAEALNEILELLRKHSVNRLYFLGNTLGIVTQTQFPIGIAVGGDASALAADISNHPAFGMLTTKLDDGVLIIGFDESSIRIALKARGEPKPELLTSIAECQGNHGVAVVLTPQVREMFDIMPEAGLIPRLAKGLTRISFYQNQTSRMLGGWLHFETADQSRQFCEAVNEEITQLLSPTNGTLPVLLVADENRAMIPEESQRQLFWRMLEKTKSAAAQMSSMNNMRQLLVAIHNFYDAYRKLPPQALTNDAGQRLLSWRVLILPFIDQMDLYNEFRLDEPWDSEHNIKLLPRMPRAYASGNPAEAAEQLQKGITCYVGPLTADSILGRQGPPLQFQEIQDGTSNTIMLVECNPEHAVPWTMPDDLVIDPANPLIKIVRDGHDHFIAGSADGAIHKLPANLASETFKALLTISGGEVVEIYKIRVND